MAKGDIVLITFPFTDLSGSKLRPAVILADTNFDLTVCFITTQIGWQEATDVVLTPAATNGLRKPSLIRTSKIATLDRALAKGLLGRLSGQEVLEEHETQTASSTTLMEITCRQHGLANKPADESRNAGTSARPVRQPQQSIPILFRQSRMQPAIFLCSFP